MAYLRLQFFQTTSQRWSGNIDQIRCLGSAGGLVKSVVDLTSRSSGAARRCTREHAVAKAKDRIE
jgi:hypothetical protein